jgi:subtilisin family serine protease
MSPATIEILEPRLCLSTTPNDPDYVDQWNLPASGLATAWDATRGSPAVVVADVDTGLDYTHPDLYLNVWINQSEIPKKLKRKLVDTDRDKRITFYDLNAPANAGRVRDANRNGYVDAGDILRPTRRGGWDDGVDQGNNGYVDDLVGWDFADDDNDPMDHDGHGTHTGGTIAAIGNNNRGVAGVAWRASLMSAKIFEDRSGEATADRYIAEAIRYTAANGARVSNNSWGGGDYSDELYDAIAYAQKRGQTFVVAAGNDRQNLDSSYAESWPAEYDLDNIVVVGATRDSGRMASYSDYGKTEVDLFAPGSGILSTTPGGDYEEMSGTSMAAPHVAGAVALVLSASPRLTAAQVKARLIIGADQASGLVATSVSNGQLDVANALANVAGARVPQTGGVGGGGGIYLPRPRRPWLPFSLDEVAIDWN